jgi:hypothetical protein
MRIDSYTKTILTLIAAALLYLCIIQTNRTMVVHADSSTSIPIVKDDHGVTVVPVVVYGAGWTNGLYTFTQKP